MTIGVIDTGILLQVTHGRRSLGKSLPLLLASCIEAVCPAA